MRRARYDQTGHRKPTTSPKRERARELRSEMTPAEIHLWEQLRRRQRLNLKFRRQHCVAGFWLDFYCHERRLAIEVDGPVHQDQEEYDASRTVILNGLGITVVRFTNEQALNETVAVLARIEAAAGPPGSGRASRKR
jgi:very-short-patch-repair endonuclease